MDVPEHADTSAPDANGKVTRTRRKPGAKAPTDTSKRSLNLRIDNETYERLHVHALRRRMTLSELVMDLAKTHLREFFISRNGGTRTEPAE